MVRRAIPYASSVDEANQIMRGNWLRAIEQHHLQYSGESVIRDILDVGCSVGESTRHIADKFPAAKVTVSELLSNKISFIMPHNVKSFLVNLNKRNFIFGTCYRHALLINMFGPGSRSVTLLSCRSST